MEKNLEKDCCSEETIEDASSDTVADQVTDETQAAEEDLSQLKEQLIKVQEERDQYLSMAQRLQADFDNFRKRNRAAVSEAYQEATLETVERFLPVLDNLQRALESTKDNDSPQAEPIIKGVEMVTKQFMDILGKMGIEEIDALGKPFDPTYHDAVMQVEAEEEEQKNTVVEVLLKGYKTDDKVIRYSMVKVAN